MKNTIITVMALLGFAWASAQTFTLKSNKLGGQAAEEQVFNGFGCNGRNTSPQLFWENAPSGTKSFAVTMFDESAPTGSGWWHWLIFDIPAGVTELKTGAGDIQQAIAPARSIQSLTDFNTLGYSGPCPPEGSGDHKYIITVYALNVETLGLDATANPALVAFMLGQNAIQRSSLIFYYKK